uniref:Glutaredoxin domain-containing protein n=1 Tax=Alexandrium monilatum TaxID=311494 RepID=A0A7S4QPI6_9DINO
MEGTRRVPVPARHRRRIGLAVAACVGTVAARLVFSGLEPASLRAHAGGGGGLHGAGPRQAEAAGPSALAFALQQREAATARAATGSGSRVDSRAANKQEIDTLIATTPALIVSKASCPFCIKAKVALDQMGAEYKVLELENMFGQALVDDVAAVQDYMLEKTGARSVPRVFIGGRFVGGCDDLMAKKYSGELLVLLQAAGAVSEAEEPAKKP